MALSVPESLNETHDVSGFDCGIASLNDWLLRRARSNQARGFTVVIVVHDAGQVAGFYGLAPTAVEASLLPRRIRTGQPPNPVPCLLIGQLAVDRRHQGQGIGDQLVLHALERVVQSAEISGGRALLVNAVNANAAAFWQAWDFEPMLSNPLLLCRSLNDIRATLTGD